jgi:zinc protease
MSFHDRVTSVALLLAALAPLALDAQAARPAVGPIRNFTPPSVAERVLDNGLRIALVPFGSTPTARIELVIRSGRAFETAAEVGVAQLVGDYLLEGTRARTGGDLGRQLASLGVVGGALDVSVGTHEIIIAGEVLSANAPALVNLIAEVARSPAFDEAALQRIKTNYGRRLESQTTAAAAIAGTRVNAILFPGDPADRLPTAEQVSAIATATLRQFHETTFVARRARLYVAGVFDSTAVANAASTAFGRMPAGTPAAPLKQSVLRTIDTQAGLPAIHVIDRPGATQSRLQVSYPVVDQMHPDHLALNELNSLMGSVQTSRIIANVRERHGYSYNVSTRLLRRPAATTWTVQADVNRDVTAAALKEILGELDRVATEPPSSEELGGFQRFMAGGTIAEMSTPRGFLDYLRLLDLYGMDLGYLRTRVQSIHAVTPGEILRVHSVYFRPERRVIVVVGDATALEPQLRGAFRIVR